MVPKAAISTWTFLDLDLASSLEAAAEAGFSGVEIWAEGAHLDPRRAGPSEARAAGALCEKLGLKPVSLHAPFGEGANLGDFDERGRREAVRVVGEAIRYARLAGARFVVVHPGSWEGSDDPREHEEFEREVAASLLELSEVARREGVSLLVENMVPTGRRFRLGAASSDLLRLCRKVPGLAVCFDVGHANIRPGGERADPAGEIRALGGLVLSLHLNDNDGRGDLHLLPGEGTVDWGEVMRALGEVGYEGPFLFEVKGGEEALEVARRAARWLRGWRG